MFVKKTRILFAAFLMLALILSACSGSGNNAEESESASPSPKASTPAASSPAASETASEAASTAPALEPVSLKWYYIQFGLPQDQDTVEKAFNAKTQELLNTTVDLIPIDAGDYENKLNTLIAAGEDFDLVWTSHWSFNYIGNVNKGAFQEITPEMLDKFAPTIKSSFTDLAWNDVRVNDKLYAIPNFQTFTKTPGFVIQKRFVDKYGFDTGKVKTYADLEPLMEQIKANESGIVPFAMNKDMTMLNEAYGMQFLGGVHYKLSDPFTLIDPLLTEEYKTHVTLMHEWFRKGYINEDAATITDLKPLMDSGNVAIAQDFTLAPGSEGSRKNDFGGNEVVYVPIAEPVFTGVQATMNAISRTSKHPDRALMLLELLNTNSELFNLLTFGVEGTHYAKLNDTTIQINKDGGYSGNTGWIFGNVTKGYLVDGQPADTWERTKRLNETATIPALSGFNFNGDQVKTEDANTAALREEYSPGIETGTIDPARALPDYISRSKKAGLEAILAEKQRQVDEWAAANGKK